MKALVKNLIASALVVSSVGYVVANEPEVKHKVIEIKAKQGEDFVINLDKDGAAQTFVFTMDELQDKQLIEDRLAGLDEDTQGIVWRALSNINKHGDGQVEIMADKVHVLNGGEGQVFSFVTTDGDAYDFDMKMLGDGEHEIHKEIIVTGGKHSLSGHSDAIVKLIERGEFKPEELDKIQAALDAKR